MPFSLKRFAPASAPVAVLCCVPFFLVYSTKHEPRMNERPLSGEDQNGGKYHAARATTTPKTHTAAAAAENTAPVARLEDRRRMRFVAARPVTTLLGASAAPERVCVCLCVYALEVGRKSMTYDCWRSGLCLSRAAIPPPRFSFAHTSPHCVLSVLL